MYILRYLLFIIFFVSQITSFSQKKDSLLQVLTTKQSDSIRISTLTELAAEVYLSNPDTAIIICEEMLKLSKKNSLKVSTAESYGWLAYLYGYSGDNKKALKYNLKSVEILKNTNLKESLANVYINIASIYSDKGDIKESLNYYNKSLVVQRASNNKKSMGITYNNMAYIYDNIGDTEKAIEYWNKGLDIQTQIKDKKGIATTYINLGVVYSEHNELDKAFELYLKSLKLYKEINDVGGEGVALKVIGNYYMKKKDYLNAEKYLKESLNLFNKIGRISRIAELYLDLAEINEIRGDFITAKEYSEKSLVYYSNLGEKTGIVDANHALSCVYFEQKKYSKSLLYAKKSFELSNDLKYPSEIQHSANQLKKIYIKLNNYKKALKYYDIEVKMRDSTINTKNYKLLIKQQIKYAFQKKLDVKNAEIKTIKLQKDLKQKQRLFYIIISIFLSLILIVLFAFFLQKTKANKNLLLQRKLLNKKSNELQKANEQIEKSEKKFKTLFEDSGDAVLILENDCIVDCNKSMLNLFGYENKEDFLKLHPSEISPKFQEDKIASFEKANAMINKVIKNKTNRFEWVHKKKNGENFYAEVLLTLISLENDKQIIHSVVRDVSERIEIEKALKSKTEKYDLVANNIFDLIWMLDINMKIVYVSPSCFNFLGYTVDELEALDIKDIHTPASYNKIKEVLGIALEYLNKNDNTPIRINYIHKNGKTIYAEVVAHIIYDESGTAIGVGGVSRDISERKKVEKALKVAIKEAETANKLKSEFLANMSHEIRTPMNAILGFSNILYDRLTDEKEKSFINKIITSGNNLLELINDILDFSKIEAGHLKIQKERANLVDIVNEIPLIFSQLSEQKSIPIEIKINEKVPHYLSLDVLRIRQVLLNLVSNALKFTEKGFISIIVTSKQLFDSDNKRIGRVNLQIKVKDTGIGIPYNQINDIFKSFRQVEGQSNRKFGGTGLGLAITKRLVELMGGIILVESKLDVGTQFIIQLNNVEVLTDDTIIVDVNKPISLKKTKILHVENDKLNREIISLYFENEDVELKEAINRNEVFEILKSFKPDLIFMDIQLNNECGFEITKEIKNIESFKNIPVFAITANATSDDLQKYSYVFDEYLTKPISKDNLFKILKKYMGYDKKEKNTPKFDVDFVNQIKNESKKTFTQDFKINFNEKIIPLFNKIDEVLLIDDLKLFVKEICNLSNNSEILGLKSYCKLLQASIDSFNITNINNLLVPFKEIIKIINEK